MKYAFDRFHEEVEARLLASGLVSGDEIVLGAPRPAKIPAALSLPCFDIARRTNKEPASVAKELAEFVTSDRETQSLIGAVTAVGPFLNFDLADEMFIQQVLTDVEEHGELYGRDDYGQHDTIIVDYSAPNVAKRMHVGHIRSTIIGQAICNILRFQGYTVIADNHLGDWGTQFGYLIAAIDREGYPKAQGDTLLARLEQLYARFVAMAEQDPDIAKEARSWSLRLEQGDATARQLWQRIIELSKAANRRNYERLGVYFDTEYGESFFASLTDQVIADAVESHVCSRTPDGALVVDLPGVPSFLLQRSDGGTLYHTRDLATIKYRVAEYQPAKIIYVVERRQELHFQQLFALARELGYARHEVDLVHVPFGTVFGADGNPLSTRRGNMVYLESLLDDAVSRARTLIDEKARDRREELSVAERESIATMVGLGAVVYNDLYQDPKRNITLDWDRMLSLEGNSATYLQYTYARCQSILRNAGPQHSHWNAEHLQHPSEMAVIKQLAQLPLAVRKAAQSYAPYIIAEWLHNTARRFAGFYRDCPVLDAPTRETRESRIQLVHAVGQCLKTGLQLLGIGVPERM